MNGRAAELKVAGFMVVEPGSGMLPGDSCARFIGAEALVPIPAAEKEILPVVGQFLQPGYLGSKLLGKLAGGGPVEEGIDTGGHL